MFVSFVDQNSSIPANLNEYNSSHFTIVLSNLVANFNHTYSFFNVKFSNRLLIKKCTAVKKEKTGCLN